MNRTRGIRANSTLWYNSSNLILNRILPTFVHKYDTQQYYNTVDGDTALPFTNTRTTNATQFDSQGRLVFAPANLLTISEPTTAVVGSPGTAPVGWGLTLGTTNGVTRSIVGKGTFNGVDYMDIQISGTFVAPENITVTPAPGVTTVAASAGESWTGSIYWHVLSGTIPNTATALLGGTRIRYGNPGLLAQAGSVNTGIYTWSRDYNTVTAPATATVVGADWVWSFGSGSSVYIILRIGGMQLEKTGIDSPKAYIKTTTTAYYGPRFDYNPTTLAPRGLLVEGAATNLNNKTFPVAADYTANFSSMANTGTICGIPAVTSTTTASSGSFVFPTTNSTSPTALTLHTSSVLVKRGNHPRIQFAVSNNHGLVVPGSDFAWVNYNFDTGVLTPLGTGAPTATATVTGDGVRLELTYTAGSVPTAGASGIILCVDSDAALRLIATSTIGATVTFTGFQYEAAGFASSIIPTYGVPATRGADTMTGTAGAWLTQSSGTLYTESIFPSMPAGVFPSIFQLDDATSANRIQIFGQSSVGTTGNGVRIDVASVAQVNGGSVNTAAAGVVNKSATSYELNNTRICFNGGSIIADAVCTIPTGLTTYRTGSSVGTTANTRWIKEIRYYATVSATTAQLQAITT